MAMPSTAGPEQGRRGETVPVPTQPVEVDLAGGEERLRQPATRCGHKDGELSAVVDGHVAAWRELRKRLADALGKHESELFADQWNGESR